MSMILLLGSAEAPPNLFAGSIWQSLAAIIAFALVLVILSRYAWGPIIKGLQDREGKIRGDLAHAEKAAKDATSTLEKYQAQLADAQKKAQQVIDQSRGEAQKVATQVKEQAQVEIAQLRDRAASEISGAKEQALAEIYEQTANLSTQIAGQILRRQINVDDQRELIEQSLRELTSRDRN